ncbi:MAG TPA: hypothetical protein P5250_04525, partial [Bacteroidales bacterium]|nr:hypothetical protein [Bacteroidales bacterium]
STPFIMHSMNKRKLWLYIGVFGIFSNIAIASYYCYIESWALSYIYHSLAGTFNGMTSNGVATFFSNYLDISTSTTGIPYEALIFFILCLSLNVWILSRGLCGGIEIASKIGVPLLILFGIFLAIKGVTLKAGHNNAIYDGIVGLNFLWAPQYSSLSNPKVWLAAAGQIFFTLSVGMGTIQCYASYLKAKDDIALNAMSAGWMNEFVEVVIGSSVIIPISIGYLGIDKVVELTQTGGLGLGFRTMPFLFQQWGNILAAISGVAFFGLLFFAGITSSLAMGTPFMGFMQDEFKWKRETAAVVFGVIIFILGLLPVLFINEDVLDEYDYWAGTVSLVIFAMLETILFAWIFGMKKGWKEITSGADIKIPLIFKYIIKFVTPIMLIFVFIGSLVRPENDDWTKISLTKWPLHQESIIGQLTHKNIGINNKWFADEYYSELSGYINDIYFIGKKYNIDIKTDDSKIKTISCNKNAEIVVKKGSYIKKGDVLYKGKVINRVFYIDMSRIILLSFFIGICLLVFYAYIKRKK